MYEDEGYYEDDYYQEQHQLRKQHLYGETLSGVLQAVTEYAKTLEHEKSNRANIERKRKSAISVIRAERRVIIEYLQQRFGERGVLYDQYFKLIDTALQLENEQILHIALENIQNIYQNNPCSGIDEFKEQFDSMNEVIRI